MKRIILGLVLAVLAMFQFDVACGIFDKSFILRQGSNSIQTTIAVLAFLIVSISICLIFFAEMIRAGQSIAASFVLSRGEVFKVIAVSKQSPLDIRFGCLSILAEIYSGKVLYVRIKLTEEQKESASLNRSFLVNGYYYVYDKLGEIVPLSIGKRE